jgi:hypothetical protein
MTFAARQIELTFTTPGATPLLLKGLRCGAIITNAGGSNAFAQCQLYVFGMTLDQMNQYSSSGSGMVAVQNQSVTVAAGNQGGDMNTIFAGTLISSFIDFANPPDVGFVCSAVAGYYVKAEGKEPFHYAGAKNAEDLISALVGQLGAPWTFVNGGAHAVVRDQYVQGSVIDQICMIARSARFPIKIENNIVSIWDNMGVVDNIVIPIGPATGMVGYPSYWEAGFIVKSEFRSMITNGRSVDLTSKIQKANGLFPVIMSTHEISTLTPDGPWFTTSKLAPGPFVTLN